MTDFEVPESPQKEPSGEQEELVLWLLGELTPDEARRVAQAWRNRPAEVERWRRFLSTTQRIGTTLRSHADTAKPVLDDSAVYGAAESPRLRDLIPAKAESARNSLREILAMFQSRVPRRLVPLALLTPVVFILLLWLAKTSLYSTVSSDNATLSVLSPIVQVFDQGITLPVGPVRAGAQIRLIGENAAARLSWSGDQCQAQVSGAVALLLTEPSLGLVQQDGQAVYEVLARERPLRVWTSQGTVEVREGRIRLTGTSANLRYEILEGTARMVGTGDVLLAGTSGQWGRPLDTELAIAGVVGDPGVSAAPEPPPANDTQVASIGAAAPSPDRNVSSSSAPADAPSGAADSPETSSPVSGRVVRTDDRGVEGAVVSLRYPGDDSREIRSRDTVTTQTDADGAFRFSNLPDVQQAVLAVSHAQLVPEAESYPIALNSNDLKIVLFEPSSISGRVVSSDDSAVAGPVKLEIVSLRKDAKPQPVRCGEGDLARATSAGDSFAIAGLRPGTYRLRVETEDGFTGESEAIALGLEQALHDVEIPVQPGGVFSGRVVDGKTLEGIAGAEVSLYPASRRGRWDDRHGREGRGEHGSAERKDKPKAQIACDDFGDFRITGILPGAYEARTNAPSFMENRLSVRIQTAETHQEVITLFGSPAVVFGRVVDGEGRSIAGAQVAAEQTPERLYDEKHATTDDEGRYEIQLPHGEWSLRAQAPKDQASWARETVAIERPGRNERNFVLFPGVRVYGTVTQSGRPLSKTKLYFANEASRAGNNATRTDEAGHYEVVLRQGRYSVFVASQRRATFDLRGIPEFQQDIAVADILIGGTVTDAETGTPIADAQLILENVDEAIAPDNGPDVMAFLRRSRFERSNKNGVYEFKNVAPGAYRLRAGAEGYAEATATGVTVDPTEETPLSVPLRLTLATALLDVKFTDDATGDPVSGALAWKTTSLETGQDLMVSARPRLSEDKGNYLITNLQPGTYAMTFIQAVGEGRYLPAVHPSVEVTAEEATRLDVAFQKGGWLRLTVKRAAEKDPSIAVPVPRARVRLTPPANVSPENLRLVEETNTDGVATFSPLPGGLYSILIESPGLPDSHHNAQITPARELKLEVLLAP